MQMSLLLLSLLLSTTPLVLGAPPPPSAAACPLDFGYVGTFPWDYTCCLPINANRTSCCQTLLSLLGIAFSEHLRLTSRFRLPDSNTSASCLSSLQSHLTSAFSLPSTLVSECFPSPDRFVIRNDTCAGIRTLQDWKRRLGNASAHLDSSCRSSLSGTLCNACTADAFDVLSHLALIDGNHSHSQDCFYLACTYVAGIVNEFGPRDLDTVTCSFRLPLLPPKSNGLTTERVKKSVQHALAATAGVFALSMVALLLLALNRGKRRIATKHNHHQSAFNRQPNTGAVWYTVADLARATREFSEPIGRGGSGVVYKGVFGDGATVAVKRVEETDLLDNEVEFQNEVHIVSNLRHRNLVPLRGVCVNDGGGEWYFIYDYMPNGSLDDHLFGAHRRPLTWQQRRDILLDVANGLAYLHHGVKPPIIHRDIKASNILLDADMRAAVADFGLARQRVEGASYATASKVAGTRGYVAPEYALYGQLTVKSDVYGFGVVVLEVVSGRRALEEPVVTEWAWGLVKDGRIGEVVEGSMVESVSVSLRMEMERFVRVGILCTHVVAASRPTMEEAARMLLGNVEVPSIPARPSAPGSHMEMLGWIH